MARNVTFQRAEQIADAVTSHVQGILPNADVMVHTVPRAGGARISSIAFAPLRLATI